VVPATAEDFLRQLARDLLKTAQPHRTTHQAMAAIQRQQNQQQEGDRGGGVVKMRGGEPSDGRDRDATCAALAASPFMKPNDSRFKHGRGYYGPMTEPRVTWACTRPPRDDHSCPPWLTATEFTDENDALRAKVRELANLMRVSRKTVLYTGAGISASVVGQAARSGSNTVGWKAHPRSVKPTLTHYALGLLGQQDLVQGWVQQNHDGLPQKAGFPQEKLNEVHGSWYDPANPVVKYSGSLHDRAYPWMVEDAETADLVIVIGTSLGGLNADQVATTCAERSLEGETLGTVTINLQQTPEDGKMTLRIFGQSDMVLGHILRELGLPVPNMARPPRNWPTTSRVVVPYDAEGRLLPKDRREKMMVLDLSDGARVRITPGHNIQGAQQPVFMHIGATSPFTYKGITKQPGPGKGRVAQRNEATSCFDLVIEGASMSLGLWWLDVAQRGGAEQLPVVNIKPDFVDAAAVATDAAAGSRIRNRTAVDTRLKKTQAPSGPRGPMTSATSGNATTPTRASTTRMHRT